MASGSELAFEAIYAALEATRGTAVDPPTRWLPFTGTLTPMRARYVPEETTGVLAARRRSKATRRWSELDANGPVDVAAMPFLMNMVMGAVTSPSTPGGGTNSRLWTFPRVMTSDTLKAATMYFGDPNIQQFQAAYMMATEYKITGDASTEDGGVENSLKATGRFPAKDAANSLPSQSLSDLLIPGMAQVWIDTSSAIGTTEFTGGELTGFDLTVPTGVVPKWAAAGVTAGLDFARIGREKVSPSQVLTFEMPNTTIYDMFGSNDGDTIAKVRVRVNGGIIEGSLRYYVQWDMYAPLEELSWTEIQNTNRGMQLTMNGQYDSTAATDLTIYVQNTLTALP